ncbi:protein ycf2 [Phtheirospermum japonicum]|uniref:Protein ycf2 n=1 Tax=Phtheirospermum japonicum TaxID=374723 RepID=A0A830C3K4_9LAMI|nr:protein ycf2 [Phtheirospermum japonicum]
MKKMGSLLMDSLRMILDLVHGLLEVEGALVIFTGQEKIAFHLRMIELHCFFGPNRGIP